MSPFKKKLKDNELEKRGFVKECIRLGKLDKKDEENVVHELLNMDIRVKRID